MTHESYERKTTDTSPEALEIAGCILSGADRATAAKWIEGFGWAKAHAAESALASSRARVEALEAVCDTQQGTFTSYSELAVDLAAAQKDLAALRAEADALRQERDEAIEALRPFATRASKFAHDDYVHDAPGLVSIKHWKRAAELTSTPRANGGGQIDPLLCAHGVYHRTDCPDCDQRTGE